MLYVEIPSGVGFSYSDTVTDYQVGVQRCHDSWLWARPVAGYMLL